MVKRLAMRLRKQRDSHDRTLRLLAAAGVALVAKRLIQRLREHDLAGEVALVMGGSRGLGLLLAQEFARAGCKVVITARDAEELREAETMLRAYTPDVLTVTCDVADKDQVDSAVRHTAARFGRVDILVNNAAIMTVGPLASMTLNDFEAAMAIMYWGMVYATLAVLPQMRQDKRGRIVNITSIGGKVSVPHMLPYSAAKFAAVGFSEGLHAELLKDGIKVTTIVPGLMRTGGTTNAFYKGDHEAEFTWLNLLDSLPISSMSAEQAAHEIFLAAKRGDAEHILTLPANLVARFNGMFPGLTSNIAGLANRAVLPSNTRRVVAWGQIVKGWIDSPLLKALISMNMRAAQRLNQETSVRETERDFS
jgi:NAD(P)-dependent dehydrogenase (short-subunit alcohol dehydrogenase family)